MHLLQPDLHSRRAFLKRSAQLALSGTALPLALNLAAMGEAAAFNATAGDYNRNYYNFQTPGKNNRSFPTAQSTRTLSMSLPPRKLSPE